MSAQIKTNKARLTDSSWPRKTQDSIQTRKRDVIVRIADWSRDKDEPAYDVEVYAHGVYDWNESKTFSTKDGKAKARARAVTFAGEQLCKLTK